MAVKVSNAVLNLVDPPLSNLVLLSATFDNVVIGSRAERGVLCRLGAINFYMAF
jgi:hypothetical protein